MENSLPKRSSFLERLTFLLLFSVLLVYILVVAKHILYPIVLALLFSYFIFPLVNFLETKAKFPRVLAILSSFVLFGIILFGVGHLFITQIKHFSGDMPHLKEQVKLNIAHLQSFINSKYVISPEDQNSWLRQKVIGILETSNINLSKIVLSATGTIEALIFIPIFSFFMLNYRERGKNFILMLVKIRHGELTESLLQQISKVTIKYVSGVAIVMGILAFSHAIAFSIIGLQYAVVIAVITASISIIPYFGTLASAVIPLFFAGVTQGNPYVMLALVIYFWIIVFIDHNILTPIIVGGNVALNPLITIIGIIVAANIWQIPGMIVIVPILAVIKIICDNVEKLKPWGYLLGTEKRSSTLKRIRQIIDERKKRTIV
ncbi:MAG: AI-2E family transporter [Bacteroidales bacterium]|nr:AI-2E family transporter [Bacteroidales bacterium]